MKNEYETYMTAGQVEIMDSFYSDQLREEFLYCHNKYLEVEKIIADESQFPATSVSGDKVKFRAVKHMLDIKNYWNIRRGLVEQYLPSEWVREQRSIII